MKDDNITFSGTVMTTHESSGDYKYDLSKISFLMIYKAEWRLEYQDDPIGIDDMCRYCNIHCIMADSSLNIEQISDGAYVITPLDTTIFNGAGINDAKKCLKTIKDLGFAEIMDGVYANLKGDEARGTYPTIAKYNPKIKSLSDLNRTMVVLTIMGSSIKISAAGAKRAIDLMRPFIGDAQADSFMLGIEL